MVLIARKNGVIATPSNYAMNPTPAASVFTGECWKRSWLPVMFGVATGAGYVERYADCGSCHVA